MKNTYENPFVQVILMNTNDVIATSGIVALEEGIGDVADWINA